MTNTEAVAAVKAWLDVDILPELKKVYGWIPAGKDHGLPDAVVVLATEGPEADAVEFLYAQLQQATMYVWRMTGSVMVQMPVDEAEEEAAQEQLQDIAERVKAALFGDPLLGGRLSEGVLAAPLALTFDYTAPYVEWEDGTRGRSVDFTFAVGEPITVED